MAARLMMPQRQRQDLGGLDLLLLLRWRLLPGARRQYGILLVLPLQAFCPLKHRHSIVLQRLGRPLVINAPSQPRLSPRRRRSSASVICQNSALGI